MKTAKLLYVIADGGRARFIERDSQGRFRTASSFESSSLHKQSRDIATDRPGRVFESADSSRHGIEPRLDPHEAEKRSFVDLVVAEIGRAHAARSFDQFVFVAPPKVVGEFRRAAPATLASALKCTLQKDLTNTPDQDLTAHLSPEALREAT